MSGPKVVRIVTREEIIAICEGQIVALEQAVKQWRRIGERNGLLTSLDVALAEERVTAMRSLLAAERFVDLQKAIPREIGFLDVDIEKRVEKAAAEAVATRKNERQRANVGTSVAAALRAKGLEVPEALLRPQHASQTSLQEALNAAFNALGPGEVSVDITERQRELASKLGSEEVRSKLADWIAAQGSSNEEDPAITLIRQRYEELRALAPDAAVPFENRLNSLDSESAMRRRLLVDSLTLDIASARKTALAQTRAMGEIEGLMAQLRTLGGVVANAEVSRVETKIGLHPSSEDLEDIRVSAQTVLDQVMGQHADEHRRRAILGGLAELGYEIEEGMETAWIKDGRVVMKSSKSPGYGVELGGDPQNMMQVRTVSFQSDRPAVDRDRDILAETEFCGDFSALQSRLAERGSALSLVKALGIGATPVKTVQASSEQTSAIADIGRKSPLESRR